MSKKIPDNKRPKTDNERQSDVAARKKKLDLVRISASAWVHKDDVKEAKAAILNSSKLKAFRKRADDIYRKKHPK